MSDDDKKMAVDGWTVLQKGHTPATGGKVQGGYEGPTGDLGGPPTTGSVVAKPPPSKKD